MMRYYANSHVLKLKYVIIASPYGVECFITIRYGAASNNRLALLCIEAYPSLIKG